MFITRKRMKKKITDTYNKGFYAGKLHGIAQIYNGVKGGNTDIMDLCKKIMNEKEVFNT